MNASGTIKEKKAKYNSIVKKIEMLSRQNEEEKYTDYDGEIKSLVKEKEELEEEIQAFDNNKTRMSINEKYRDAMSLEELLELVENTLDISLVVGYESDDSNYLKAVRLLVKDNTTLEKERKIIVGLLTDLRNDKAIDEKPFKAMKRAVMEYYSIILDGKIAFDNQSNDVSLNEVVEEMENIRENHGYGNMSDAEQKKMDRDLRRKFILNEEGIDFTN